MRSAARWYGLQRSELGREFVAEVDRTLDRVAENPFQYRALYREARRSIVRRFPYGIFYRVEGRVGFSLRLPIPEGATSHEGSDIDYSDFSIWYGPEDNRAWIREIGNGPNASLGVPPEEWILNAKEFSERSYRDGKAEGAAMRGQSADGRYWRYIGNLGESIQYSDLTLEQAAFFERHIDRACIKQ